MDDSESEKNAASVAAGWRARMSGFVNAQLNRLGYALVRTDNQRIPSGAIQGGSYAYDNLVLLDVLSPWLLDDSFLRIWRRASLHTLTDIYRGYELYQCVREAAPVAGDILEVGVWRGGSGAILASAAQRWMPNSRVWLCDTFSGVVKAGQLDPTYRGGEHSDTSPAVVAALMKQLRLTNTVIAEGVFPDDSAVRLGDSRVALCHIDVDVYQSAADVVAWVLPRMAGGGMLVFDDYGFSTCKGITRLVDELRSSGNWIYFYNLNKHAVLVRR